jgi:hypothetical protein
MCHTIRVRGDRGGVPRPYLDAECCQDGLCVDQVGVAQVVEAALLEDLGTSLEPHGLGNVATCTTTPTPAAAAAAAVHHGLLQCNQNQVEERPGLKPFKGGAPSS